jgi:hypothetical protein
MRTNPVKLRRAADGRWQIMVLMRPDSATEAAWLPLGGCPSQEVATRVWLAVVAQGGR